MRGAGMVIGIHTPVGQYVFQDVFGVAVIHVAIGIKGDFGNLANGTLIGTIQRCFEKVHNIEAAALFCQICDPVGKGCSSGFEEEMILTVVIVAVRVA